MTTPASSKDTRRQIKGVTLCAIDCQTPGLAARALTLSQAGCSFGDAVLFTDTPVPGGPFRNVPIFKIKSMEAYQDFTTKHLVRQFKSSHVLIVQWDGYVVEPAMWDDEFLSYDYIGAVWPKQPPGSDVGNSGFSLQSRKLLEAVLNFTRQPGTPDDLFICRQIRPLLERDYGIRFAPAEVARRFSLEEPSRTGKSFGFHGMFLLADYVPDAEIADFARQLPPGILAQPRGVFMLMFLQDTGRYDAVRILYDFVAKAGLEEQLYASLRKTFRDPERAAYHTARLQQIVGGSGPSS